jgi:hypothetical protein
MAFTPLLDPQRSAPGAVASPDDRCRRPVFSPDSYRFCKKIRDTIKAAVNIGCGAEAGRRAVLFLKRLAGHYEPTDGWQMRHAFRFLSGEPACSRPILLSRATRSTSFKTGINHFLEGQMRSLKLGLAATAMVCALSATAQADCRRVGAVGEAVTHDIAFLFATHGLANVIYGQGRVGKGPVHTKCEDGSGMTTCHSSQMACKVTTPKTCLGAWLCFPA